MELRLSAIGAFAALAGGPCASGRWLPGMEAEPLDRKPTGCSEGGVRCELDALEQTLEPQNERRRRRGAAEPTEDSLYADVGAEERERGARAARYRSRGPALAARRRPA
jgi:hypothetical protein